MGDSFGWFRWNAGLFGDLDLFGVIDANQRRGWFLDGRSRIGKFRVGRFFMAPILQSLESRCCVDHGIESLEIPEFGKVKANRPCVVMFLLANRVAEKLHASDYSRSAGLFSTGGPISQNRASARVDPRAA